MEILDIVGRVMGEEEKPDQADLARTFLGLFPRLILAPIVMYIYEPCVRGHFPLLQ